MIRFAVLGSGPAGLLSAHAIHLMGYDFEIISQKKPSKQYGAQWLHEPIFDITSNEPDGYVDVSHRGDETMYARKVYGDGRFPTSFGVWGRDGSVPAWDLREAYALLWEKYEDKIIDRLLDPEEVENIVKSGTYDHVFSSIPRHILCRSISVNGDVGGEAVDHKFHSQRVWVQPASIEQPRTHNFVIYNGEKTPAWYRSSSVFGYGMLEWGDYYPGGKPPFDGVVPVEKPINTNCDCWDGSITGVGRYGEWRKGVLSHDAMMVTALVVKNLTLPECEPNHVKTNYVQRELF